MSSVRGEEKAKEPTFVHRESRCRFPIDANGEWKKCRVNNRGATVITHLRYLIHSPTHHKLDNKSNETVAFFITFSQWVAQSHAVRLIAKMSTLKYLRSRFYRQSKCNVYHPRNIRMARKHANPVQFDCNSLINYLLSLTMTLLILAFGDISRRNTNQFVLEYFYGCQLHFTALDRHTNTPFHQSKWYTLDHFVFLCVVCRFCDVKTISHGNPFGWKIHTGRHQGHPLPLSLFY